MIIQSQVEPTALYFTSLHHVLGILLLRNFKKEIYFFWPDFIYHKAWILISQGVELVGGEEWFEFLPLYPLLISHLYWTVRELRKEFKMCDRGLWKTLHLNDVQRATDRYQKYILEHCGLSFKLDVSEDFPAGYFWSKKTFTGCHLTMFLEVF